MKSKELKRNEAQERQSKYDKLTPQQKLNGLDKRLGKGIGAKKQRAGLKNQIEREK